MGRDLWARRVNVYDHAIHDSEIMYGHRYGIGNLISNEGRDQKRDAMYRRASILICMFRLPLVLYVEVFRPTHQTPQYGQIKSILTHVVSNKP